jgi:cytochrome c biogenesis protein CcmG/thiol:disulfide interchange protein DsbE
MNRAIAFAPLVLLALLVMVSVALLLKPGEHQTITTGQMGRPAPSYSLVRLGGGDRVANTTTLGHAHLINVFASWCGPCIAENAQLMALQAGGVDIIGVAYKDNPNDTQLFLEGHGNPFSAVGIDRDGQFGLQLGVAGVPETFVVNAAGKIVAVHRGPLTPADLEREIYPALRRA